MEANRASAGPNNNNSAKNNAPTNLPPAPRQNDNAVNENNNNNEINFNQFWLNQLSSTDTWADFEAKMNEFTVAALEEARKHNHASNNNHDTRPRPQPRPNNVPPRATNRRPQNFYDAREASRLQRLYKMARKRAFRQITKDNDTKYDGGKGRAEAYFNDVHSGKNIDSVKLNELLQQYIPKSSDNSIFRDPFTNKEITTRLNKMSNTSPGPDKIEYKHLKSIDNTGRVLTFIFNKCREA